MPADESYLMPDRAHVVTVNAVQTQNKSFCFKCAIQRSNVRTMDYCKLSILQKPSDFSTKVSLCPRHRRQQRGQRGGGEAVVVERWWRRSAGGAWCVSRLVLEELVDLFLIQVLKMVIQLVDLEETGHLVV